MSYCKTLALVTLLTVCLPNITIRADIAYTVDYVAELKTSELGSSLVGAGSAPSVTSANATWTSSDIAPFVAGESAHTTPSGSTFTLTLTDAAGVGFGGTATAGLGPVGGDANDFDPGEKLTATFSGISPPTTGGSQTGTTSSPTLTLTDIDFEGLEASGSDFEYFTITAGSTSRSFVDSSVSAATITAAGLNAADFDILDDSFSGADSMSGLNFDITSGFDVEFFTTGSSTGVARLQSFGFTANAVSPVPEPSGFLFLGMIATLLAGCSWQRQLAFSKR